MEYQTRFLGTGFYPLDKKTGPDPTKFPDPNSDLRL